ncbi:MAG: extracellular solute-binding protein, partial [Acidimicrobiia bacterium]|nr:extracellular solute-binding protein [Acidimicrobiia bacterium]
MLRLLTRSLASVAVIFAMVGIAGCSGSDEALVVYSGRTENLIGPLIDRFSDQTGIEVQVRYDDSANLALLIDQEGSRSPADVFISQSPGAVGFLAGKDRLTPIDAKVLELVPARFRNAGGLWVGLSGRVRTIVYNPELIDPSQLPDSVFDLTDVSFMGDVGLAPENGSFQDFVTAMRQISGDDVTADWLEAMSANDAQAYANNSAIVEAVRRGEIPLGLVNHYYNLRAIAEDPNTITQNYFFP